MVHGIQYTLLVGTLFQEYFDVASNLVKVGINTKGEKINIHIPFQKIYA